MSQDHIRDQHLKQSQVKGEEKKAKIGQLDFMRDTRMQKAKRHYIQGIF